MRTIAAVDSPFCRRRPRAAGYRPRLRVTNPSTLARPMETVEVAAAVVAGTYKAEDMAALVVTDATDRARGPRARPWTRTATEPLDRLVFQADFAPGETREFTLARGEARKPRLADYRVYGRFVRERHDDFAWENDRVAFRIYGQALETFEKEPLTSSTVDAWSKRTRRLVLNDWYLVDDYHRDHGEGGDFYSAGRTRGCGGSGLMVDGALAVSKNFRSSRVLASGPLRRRLRGLLPGVGEAGAGGDRGEARHARRRQPLQPVRELLPDGGRRHVGRRHPQGQGRRAARRPRARHRADVGAPDELRRQRLARLRPRDRSGHGRGRGRAGRQPARRGADPEGSARHLVRGLRLGPERRTSRTWPPGTATSTPSPRACARR